MDWFVYDRDLHHERLKYVYAILVIHFRDIFNL